MTAHEPLSDEHERMNKLARLLDEMFNGKDEPRKIGFALLVYKLGEQKDGRINYIGNGRRGEVREALQGLLDRWGRE